MKKNYIILLFLNICNFSVAQQRSALTGQVVFENEPVKGVWVLNRTTKMTTMTNLKGAFTIDAQEKDEIVVYDEANVFEPILKIVSPLEVKQKKLRFNSMEKPTQLKEMVIDQTVTSKSLGLNQLKYEKPHPVGMDFIAIFKAVFGKPDKDRKPEEPEITIDEKIIMIQNRITETRLLNDYELKKEEIGRLYYFLGADKNFMQTVRYGNKERFEFELIEKIYQFRQQVNNL